MEQIFNTEVDEQADSTPIKYRELMTISRLKSARLCRRQHYYRYEACIKPLKVSEALGFGSLFHIGLEQYWLKWLDIQNDIRNNDPDRFSPLDAYESATFAMFGKFEKFAEEADLSIFDLIKAEELMRGYHFRWLPEMVDIEVIAVEEQFDMSLVNVLTGRSSTLFKLGGKLDVRIRYKGELRIVEHKTTTMDITPGADYWVKLRMDGQVSQYVDGANSIEEGDYDCLYDVAKRPMIRQKMATPMGDRKYITKQSKLKDGTIRPAGSLRANQRAEDETPDEFRYRLREDIGENPDKYYQRAEIVRLEEELDEHRFDTWRMAKEIRSSQLATPKLGHRAWPRNPDACSVRGINCEYFAVCTNAASIDDETLFRKGKAHEELKEGEDSIPEGSLSGTCSSCNGNFNVDCMCQGGW